MPISSNLYLAASMQAVLSTRNPSVRPSVKRVNYDKTKKNCAKILITYKRFLHQVFAHSASAVTPSERVTINTNTNYG